MPFLRFMSGPAGRAIRIAGGLALVTGGLAAGGHWRFLSAFGTLPLATGVFDLCPIALLRRLPIGGKAFIEATCDR